MPTLPTINMLWVEGRLGALERACIRSVQRQGHPLVLWHYFPLEGVPAGVDLRDGHAVVPRERLFRHEPTGSWSLFSNLFRYSMLQRGLGLWSDCDSYLLKPIVWDGGLLAARDSAGLVAMGLFGLPADSPLLTELIGYFDGREIPPWVPLRWKLRFAWQRWQRGQYRIAQMPWGDLGPHALTALVARHGLAAQVLPPDVFYPWTWQEADLVFAPEETVLARLTPDTHALHLYNQVIRERKDQPAPPGSFLARLQREGA